MRWGDDAARARRLTRWLTHRTHTCNLQRKLVTVGLVPAGLTFVSQVRNRTLLGSLLVISVNWLVTGFVLHLLLRRGHPGAAAAHGSLAAHPGA